MSTDSAEKTNILVVDDTPANVALLSTMLSDRGYKVRPAVNGELALAAARKSLPDLILLDITMPDMDGYEVCQILKDDPETAGVPIIFISALDEVMDKVKAFQVGGVDYITKPFQFEEVLARVENQLTLMHQRREIEELSALKDQLLRTVSHDLKNPLGVLIGYADMLKDNHSENPAKVREVSERIKRNANKMYKLVTDLLDLNKIQDKAIYLSMHFVPLHTLIPEIVSDFELIAEEKDITLHAVIKERELIIRADRARLEQVVANLVSNAIKYTPEGGSVTLSTYIEGSNVVIEVADTGLGIPKEDLPHLGQQFFRVATEEHRKQEGTGLGLSIVNSLVEQHGGEIQVESEPGVGTTFRILLPDQ